MPSSGRSSGRRGSGTPDARVGSNKLATFGARRSSTLAGFGISLAALLSFLLGITCLFGTLQLLLQPCKRRTQALHWSWL